MKKITGSGLTLFCIMAVTALSFLPAKSWGQGSGITIKTFCGITDYNISPTDFNLIINGIKTGNPASGWVYYPNNSQVYLGDVLSHNGSGRIMNSGLSITDPNNTFTLAQIQYTMSRFFPTTSGTFGGQGLTYDQFGIGINYGPDGIPGTADDTTYTSGNANTPVNAFYGLGMFDTFDTGGQADNIALDTWAIDGPINVTETYTLNGISASATMIYYVPAPITLAITQTSNSIVVSWPDRGSNTLQQTSNLAGGNWTTTTNAITTSNGTNRIAVALPANSLFFRLKQ